MKLFPNWALLKTTRCSPRISHAGKTKTTEDKHLPEATEAARTLTPAPCPPEQHVPKATGAARTLTPGPVSARAARRRGPGPAEPSSADPTRTRDRSAGRGLRLCGAITEDCRLLTPRHQRPSTPRQRPSGLFLN